MLFGMHARIVMGKSGSEPWSEPDLTGPNANLGFGFG